jgi:hypothetical protein
LIKQPELESILSVGKAAGLTKGKKSEENIGETWPKKQGGDCSLWMSGR